MLQCFLRLVNRSNGFIIKGADSLDGQILILPSSEHGGEGTITMAPLRQHLADRITS